MSPKKKAVKKEKTHERAPQKPVPLVTQVVEEVDDSEKSVAEDIEEIKKDAQDIERTAVDLEESTEKMKEEVRLRVENAEGQESGAGAESGLADEAKKEEAKEVVEGLFTGEKPQISPEISVHTNDTTRPLIIWAVIVIGVALLTGGGLMVVLRGSPKLPSVFVKPTPTPTPAPTPTPTPALVNRGDIRVQVLNGGGTPGAASAMKAFLTEKGYQVADIGNTKEYTYEKTEVMVKAGKEAYLPLFEEDLAKKYTVGSTSADLSQDVSYDARVIVGKE